MVIVYLFTDTTIKNDIRQIGTTIADQMDLLHEQTKILVGEVALRTSSLNRLSEQAARNPEDFHIRVSFSCDLALTMPK